MRKAIFSFLILLSLIFFCQCATNFPNDFEGITWGLPMDKCKDYLNSNNIKYKTNYSDYDEYLETEGTFFGIENVSIQYHFLKNKFYKGSVYIKHDIEFIDGLEKILDAFVLDTDNKYQRKHYRTILDDNQVSYAWPFRKHYINLITEFFLNKVILVEISYISTKYNKSGQYSYY